MIKKIIIAIIAVLLIGISIAGATAYGYRPNPYLSGPYSAYAGYQPSVIGSSANWGYAYARPYNSIPFSNYGGYRAGYYSASRSYNGYNRYNGGYGSSFHLTNTGASFNVLGVSGGVGYPSGGFGNYRAFYI